MSDQDLNDTHPVARQLAWRISRGPTLGNIKVEEAIIQIRAPIYRDSAAQRVSAAGD